LKSKFTQRRYRAPKRCLRVVQATSTGWADKKNAGDLRQALWQEQKMQDCEQELSLAGFHA
jgi:hypothetical protein